MGGAGVARLAPWRSVAQHACRPEGPATLAGHRADVAGARLLLRAAAWVRDPAVSERPAASGAQRMLRARRCRARNICRHGHGSPPRAQRRCRAAHGCGRGAGKAPCCATSRVQRCACTCNASEQGTCRAGLPWLPARGACGQSSLRARYPRACGTGVCPPVVLRTTWGAIRGGTSFGKIERSYSLPDKPVPPRRRSIAGSSLILSSSVSQPMA